MRKRTVKITYSETPFGTSIISVDNARLCEYANAKIVKFINDFTDSKELYFGFFRKDGTFLSREQESQYKREIHEFFNLHGEYKQLDEKTAVARINRKTDNREVIPKVFQYYLHTLVFSPLKNWEEFQSYHKDFLKHRCDEYILNGYADVLFYYYDSGDFAVVFDSKKYSPPIIRKLVDELFL